MKEGFRNLAIVGVFVAWYRVLFTPLQISSPFSMAVGADMAEHGNRANVAGIISEPFGID